ncbi:MAG: hypothetical protein QOC80_2114, partial [Frankiaceae bacterium]|nr:hypothetical protein [Frankiaceae bacterium]
MFGQTLEQPGVGSLAVISAE